MSAIHDLPPEFVTAQMDAVFADIAFAAVKIGMLSRPAIIDAVADGLRRHGARNVVLDPVMVAKSGDRLLRADAVAALRQRLLPLATVITPNLPEAGAARSGGGGGRGGHDRRRGAAACARPACGPAQGRASGEGASSVDVLDDGAEPPRWPPRASRPQTPTVPAARCRPAIAALLARGLPLRDAVREAKAYVTAAIRAADRLKVGHGHGPVHHFHALWREGGR